MYREFGKFYATGYFHASRRSVQRMLDHGTVINCHQANRRVQLILPRLIRAIAATQGQLIRSVSKPAKLASISCHRVSDVSNPVFQYGAEVTRRCNLSIRLCQQFGGQHAYRSSHKDLFSSHVRDRKSFCVKGYSMKPFQGRAMAGR